MRLYQPIRHQQPGNGRLKRVRSRRVATSPQLVESGRQPAVRLLLCKRSFGRAGAEKNSDGPTTQVDRVHARSVPEAGSERGASVLCPGASVQRER